MRNYAGPRLGQPAGWECPYCGAPNASARGTQCVHCGKPDDDSPAPILATARDPEGAVTSPLDAPLGSNAEVSDGPRQALVRRYKLIEYYGEPDWVEATIQRSLYGAQSIGTQGYLIGTEVSEAAINSQTELVAYITQARSDTPRWEAGFWAEAKSKPVVSTFKSALQEIEAVMEQDPRYAATLVAALDAWYADGSAKGANYLTVDEVDNVIKVLRALQPTPPVQEATPA